MMFSIIIPVYNVENYLRDCLDSVLNQSFNDWEAICVNDGSTDGSAAILESYAEQDSRFIVISQPNGGLSAARNTGLDAAQGDYVLFLDSDDWLESDALHILSGSITDEDLLCFNGRRFFEKEREYENADHLEPAVYESGWDYYSHNALCHRNFAFVCVVLRCYRRSYLLDHGLRFKTGIYHEDNLFTPLACYQAYQVRVINDCLYNYRVRSDSITTTSNPKRLRDLLETANSLAAFFISEKGINKSIIYRAITHHYQVVFLNASNSEIKELNELCDWRLYRIVSKTKPRHVYNYWVNRIKAL